MSKQEMQIADQILLASAVITCNDAWVIFQPGAVAILDHQIVAVGHPADILGAFQSNMTFDFGAKVIMPGLVNTHTHAPMTLLRGLADDLRLDVWLMGYVMPVERQFVTPEMCYLGTRLACAEMIRSGVTCFADMYYFEDQVAQATADSGLRAVCCETILKFPAPDATSYEHSLAYTRDFIQKWQHHPLITPGIAPHAPYTCTAEILQACSALAQEWDAPLQIHLSETEREVQEMQQLHKLRGAAWLHQNNVFKAKTLAAHCVYLDDSEMRLLYEHQAGVLHNPTSNLKLASGVAPVAQMLAHGLAVGIATDGPASNNDLDMFEEMRLTALLAKGISKDPTALPARTVFGMATIGGRTRYSSKPPHRLARSWQTRRFGRHRYSDYPQHPAVPT
jgi:5-methylthioadenosine/S-adenosylhomocysteine deaminase